MEEQKTNVRANSKPERPSYTPAPLAALGKVARVSPGLAGWMGAHLFTKTRRRPRPGREVNILKEATLLALPQGVAAWTWGHGPLVLLVHGWEGRGAQLGAFVAPLVRRGFRVATFDARGHGDSVGEQATILDWLDPIHALIQRFGDPAAVVAHSFGCPAVSLALRRGLEASALVYVAPPDALDLGVRSFTRVTGMGKSGELALRKRLSAMTGLRFEEQRVVAFGPGMRTPLLVVHDEGDVDVSVRCAATYAQHWPGSTVATTRGLGHRRILGDQSVVDKVSNYVEAQYAAASGLSRWFSQDAVPRAAAS